MHQQNGVKRCATRSLMDVKTIFLAFVKRDVFVSLLFALVLISFFLFFITTTSLVYRFVSRVSCVFIQSTCLFFLLRFCSIIVGAYDSFLWLISILNKSSFYTIQPVYFFRLDYFSCISSIASFINSGKCSVGTGMFVSSIFPSSFTVEKIQTKKKILRIFGFKKDKHDPNVIWMFFILWMCAEMNKTKIDPPLECAILIFLCVLLLSWN